MYWPTTSWLTFQELNGLTSSSDPSELDSWLAVGKDGRVTAFFGKPDIGLGVDTAISQIVAEELDVAFDHVRLVTADTALTVNQGGVSGSYGIQGGANPLRHAAAEARSILVSRAASRLGVTADRLHVRDGIVQVIGDPGKQISYGELVTGAFNRELEWNGQMGNRLDATGKAKPKSPGEYRLVGTSQHRPEVHSKSIWRV